MQARPLKFLNGSERALVAANAGLAHAQWLRAWAGDAQTGKPPTCAPAADHADSVVVGGDWLRCAAASGSLYLANAESAQRIARTVIGGTDADDAPPPGSIAGGLVQQALQDLAQRIAGSPVTVDADGPSADVWLPASGAALVRLPSTTGQFEVILDQRLVAHMLAAAPQVSRRLPPLINPQLGLGGQPVELRVWLGSAELDLAMFQSLAVNDVILLESRIDQPLRVTVAGREVSPRAFLGHAGEQKAIRLTSTPSRH